MENNPSFVVRVSFIEFRQRHVDTAQPHLPNPALHVQHHPHAHILSLPRRRNQQQAGCDEPQSPVAAVIWLHFSGESPHEKEGLMKPFLVKATDERKDMAMVFFSFILCSNFMGETMCVILFLFFKINQINTY